MHSGVRDAEHLRRVPHSNLQKENYRIHRRIYFKFIELIVLNLFPLHYTIYILFHKLTL